jgi:16S rRNA (cytidine1402-2'-O)-methyltransferase
MPKLFLIPNLISDSPWQEVLSGNIAGIIGNLTCFIVEDTRNARRFLKKIVPDIQIDTLQFFELNKHTSEQQKREFLQPLINGVDMGIISEAGCPGVADPGAEIVMMAHQKNFRVVPLAGPSSILLALMASGLNGQNFTFSGYLPVKPVERIKEILQLERSSSLLHQSSIFMETPYRNNQLLNDLVRTCHPSTLLCIAADLTSQKEWIATRSIADWKKQLPDLDKQPVIYILESSNLTR